jgi:hypothetical protein
MPEETTPEPVEKVKQPAASEQAEKPAAKPKKEKPPALEDKPFVEFIQQDYLPALKAALIQDGIEGVELSFEKDKVNVIGYSQAPESWQVIGRWSIAYKQNREFRIYFFDETINGKKGFSCAEGGGKASTLESFRIDERKSDLGLLVFWAVQRLTAQKWLVRN